MAEYIQEQLQKSMEIGLIQWDHHDYGDIA